MRQYDRIEAYFNFWSIKPQSLLFAVIVVSIIVANVSVLSVVATASVGTTVVTGIYLPTCLPISTYLLQLNLGFKQQKKHQMS